MLDQIVTVCEVDPGDGYLHPYFFGFVLLGQVLQILARQRKRGHFDLFMGLENPVTRRVRLRWSWNPGVKLVAFGF